MVMLARRLICILPLWYFRWTVWKALKLRLLANVWHQGLLLSGTGTTPRSVGLFGHACLSLQCDRPAGAFVEPGILSSDPRAQHGLKDQDSGFIISCSNLDVTHYGLSFGSHLHLLEASSLLSVCISSFSATPTSNPDGSSIVQYSLNNRAPRSIRVCVFLQVK